MMLYIDFYTWKKKQKRIIYAIKQSSDWHVIPTGSLQMSTEADRASNWPKSRAATLAASGKVSLANGHGDVMDMGISCKIVFMILSYKDIH